MNGDEPELARMRAEYEQTMRLISKMREPTEAELHAVGEMMSPEGWQRAIREAINAPNELSSQKKKHWLPIVIIINVVVLLIAVTAAILFKQLLP